MPRPGSAPQLDVSLVVKFAAAMASFGQISTVNRRISNIEPQNYEGWNRCALSFELIKIDRNPSFDIQNSKFDIRYSPFIS
jgi:hypothetical protein